MYSTVMVPQIKGEWPVCNQKIAVLTPVSFKNVKINILEEDIEPRVA